jgi:hypothetical protein
MTPLVLTLLVISNILLWCVVVSFRRCAVDEYVRVNERIDRAMLPGRSEG